MVNRYTWDEENYPPDGMELVAAVDYDAAQARIRELEAENERLLSLVQAWIAGKVGIRKDGSVFLKGNIQIGKHTLPVGDDGEVNPLV